MRSPRTVMFAAMAAAIAALPLASATAQYYPCNAFPLTWPFCVAGAAVGTAAAIATAPFGYPYYYYGYPYYYGPAYYPVRHHYRRRHHYHG